MIRPSIKKKYAPPLTIKIYIPQHQTTSPTTSKKLVNFNTIYRKKTMEQKRICTGKATREVNHIMMVPDELKEKIASLVAS